MYDADRASRVECREAAYERVAQGRCRPSFHTPSPFCVWALVLTLELQSSGIGLRRSRHDGVRTLFPQIVIEAAARATGRFAEDYDTIYDGVLGPWFLPTFASASGLSTLDYVIILPPIDLCVSRVSSRVEHSFSDEAATRSMHAAFAQATIDRRHVLELGGRDPAETVEAILDARAAGRLLHEVDEGVQQATRSLPD